MTIATFSSSFDGQARAKRGTHRETSQHQSIVVGFSKSVLGLDSKPEWRAELEAIASNPDGQEFWRELLAFSRKTGQISALQSFAALAPAGAEQSLAQTELAALSGIGPRPFEQSLGSFIQQATDYRTIVPMLAGSMAFQLSRSALAFRYGASESVWLKSVLPNALSFGAEVGSFTAASRLLQGAALPLERQLPCVALTLGAFKLAGVVATRMTRPLQQGLGLNARSAEALGTTLQSGASLLGLYASHRIEQGLGLKSTEERFSIGDGVASLLALSVGSRIGNAAFGKSWTSFAIELAGRSGTPRGGRLTWLPELMGETTAGSARLPSESLNTAKPMLMAMQVEGSGNGKSLIYPTAKLPPRLKRWRGHLFGHDMAKVFDAPNELLKISRIDPDQALALAREILSHMEDQGLPHHRVRFLYAIGRLSARMRASDQVSWTHRALAFTADTNPELRLAAAELAGELIPLLPEPSRLRAYHKLAANLIGGDARMRETTLRSLDRAFASLPNWSRERLYRDVENLLGDSDSIVAFQAVMFCERNFSSLNTEARMEALHRVLKRLQASGKTVSGNLNAIREQLGSLDPQHRSLLLLDVFKEFELDALPAPVWGALVEGLDSLDGSYLDSHAKNQKLQKVLNFQRAGLPWQPYFWKVRYLNESEPEEWLLTTGLRMRALRRGAPVVGNYADLMLSFYAAGLDQSPGLDFAGYNNRVSAKPFSTDAFLGAAFRAKLWNQRQSASEQLYDTEFVPSKGEADQFYPEMAEGGDTLRGSNILSPDFQIYRMIAREELRGVIEVQRATLGKKNVLILGVHPRRDWDVDPKLLLDAVTDNFTKIAEVAGYDAVLLPKAPRRQSVREAMQVAIAKRGFPLVRFESADSGSAFPGREFLAIWRRPRGTKPSSPP